MMRSLGAKDKSSVSASMEGSLHKKSKFANVDFQFQSDRASQESTLRAWELYQLNAALQGSPPAWASNSMNPRQHELARYMAEPDAGRPLIRSMVSSGLMASTVHAPSCSDPIHDYLQSQTWRNQAAVRGSRSIAAAAAAVAVTPLRMAPNRNVWSPTLLLSEAAAMVAPPVRTSPMVPFSLWSEAAMVAPPMRTVNVAHFPRWSESALKVAPPMRTVNVAHFPLLSETTAMVAPPVSRFVDAAPVPRFSLSCSTDRDTLSAFQVFLRLHIEAFGATQADTMSHTRGRNKRIHLGQVGIRCRHCAHVPSSHRTKGSVYFPASTMGVYQAAQNMCATHLQCGLCPDMPESIKTLFAQLLVTKTSTNCSSGGRAYWSHCVQARGLIDTDHGIFPRHSIPHSVRPLNPTEQTLYQTSAAAASPTLSCV